MLKKLLKHRLVRFVSVGVSNAVLHFTVLNISFYLIGLGKIPASILATVCAVTYSFFLNRNFVFKDKGGDKALVREAILFAVVTLTGMLIVHNITYAGFIAIIDGREKGIIDLIQNITGITLAKDFIDINMATVVGAVVAMVWNYNGYRLLVFKKVDETEQGDEQKD